MDDSSPPTVQDIPIGIKTDAAHRQEFDSMGYVMAPADRYWGAQSFSTSRSAMTERQRPSTTLMAT
ncbi:MAG: hypothetical protein WB715_10835 [Roseiarcus sp.]|uniref:hypothetical protein n=1 Tax=Roseiarcus sp. TaxID=1969460 RepID=UPI003C44EC6E